MAPTEVTIGLGGAAGDGIAKTGDTLAKTCARVGLHLYAYNSYQSLIRGGHAWLRVRISEDKVASHGDHLNLIIALNQDTVERHLEEIEPEGGILFNQDKLDVGEDDLPHEVSAFPLPVRELTKDYKYKPIMQNTVALGALLWLTGLDIEVASGVFADIFAHKGQEIIDINVGICRAGYDYAREKFQPLDLGLDPNGKQLAVLTGNTAFGLGAAAAGCKFYSAYPMTPATSVLHWFVAHSEKLGIVVKQCEDEIAAVNYAIGAGHVGVRAFCGTSGGGFQGG